MQLVQYFVEITTYSSIELIKLSINIENLAGTNLTFLNEDKNKSNLT